MNRITTTAALLLLAGSAPLHGLLGQPLPSPQFATPPTNDNSNTAATTAWVRGLTLGAGAGGDLSANTVLVPGSSVARSLAARAAIVFNVLDYGARNDGVTDIAPALNVIAGLLAPNGANVILFPAGSYALKSAVTFNGVAPTLQGQGFTAGPAPASGTMVTISGTGYVPITFTGVNARGAVVRDIAFRQVQPATGPGWRPTDYDYVFKVLNALGEVSFDNVLFAGVTRGIYASNSGRLNIRDVSGQFYTAGIEIDDCFDIPRIQHLHAWTYQSADPSVVTWQQANQDTVILRRVDGIFVGDLFSLGARSALRVTSGANGTTTKFYVGNLYADFVKYGIWIDGNGASGQIANVTTQHNDQTAPATRLPGGRGMLIDATNVVVQIDNWRTDLAEGSAIDVERTGNRVDLGKLWVNGYNFLNDGTPAVFVADSGAGPTNTLNILGQPYTQNGNGGPLVNASNGASARTVLMNLPGGAANEPRFYAGAAGNPVSAGAIGPDANIDFYVGAKGPGGSVRLRAQNSNVLRLDSPGPGDTDLLLRSGAGAASFITESAQPNADIFLGAKGSGSIRLQSGGATVLRTTAAGGTDTDALVTGGTGRITISPENAGNAADLVLAGQGAGNGVRLLANGGVALRADNPGAGDSDLLVRPGTAGVNLITESGAANADLSLAAKGSGAVRLQSGGLVTLRTDNPAAGDSALLVRPGTAAVNLITESAAANAELSLASKGAGTIKLQVGGVTTLRADNPAGGNGGLLIRSGTDTVSLTAEGPNANANIVLTPKGTGTVVVPTVPPSDNSTNAASTAYVRSLGFLTAAPVASVAGRTGSVTLAVADVAGAAPITSPTLNGTTQIIARSSAGFKLLGPLPGASGFANSGTYMLVNTTASTTPTRLTVDGAAPSATNCVNPANNTALDLFIEVVGIDRTAAGNVARYRALDVLMYRGAGAGTVQVVNGATAAAVNGSIGGGATATFTVAADTTNGCLALSVAAPNGNTWAWAARVRSTEVQ